MQKISGILPGSSRVTSVDLKASRPVRPGVPSFGAPQGESNLRDQVTRSGIAMTDPNSIDVPRWRSKEDANAEIARNLTNQFFRKKIEETGPEISASVTMYEPSSARTGGLDMMDLAIADESENSPEEYFVANNKPAAYFRPEEESEPREGLVLDMVA